LKIAVYFVCVETGRQERNGCIPRIDVQTSMIEFTVNPTTETQPDDEYDAPTENIDEDDEDDDDDDDDDELEDVVAEAGQ